jgi:hypothetical protein
MEWDRYFMPSFAGVGQSDAWKLRQTPPRTAVSAAPHCKRQDPWGCGPAAGIAEVVAHCSSFETRSGFTYDRMRKMGNVESPVGCAMGSHWRCPVRDSSNNGSQPILQERKTLRMRMIIFIGSSDSENSPRKWSDDYSESPDSVLCGNVAGGRAG